MREFLMQFAQMPAGAQLAALVALVGGIVALARRFLNWECKPGTVTTLAATGVGVLTGAAAAYGGAEEPTMLAVLFGALFGGLAGWSAIGGHQTLVAQPRKVAEDTDEACKP